ncbi:MAG: hypothetical protein DMG05_26800, partial [Acidobacteria bacterium]
MFLWYRSGLAAIQNSEAAKGAVVGEGRCRAARGTSLPLRLTSDEADGDAAYPPPRVAVQKEFPWQSTHNLLISISSRGLLGAEEVQTSVKLLSCRPLTPSPSPSGRGWPKAG